MQVRQAAISDAHRIAEIHVETWQQAYRGQMPDAVLDKLDVEKRAAFWRTHLLQQPLAVLVAASDHAIIGFCDLIPSRDRDADPKLIAEIAAIYVHPDWWRKGAGRLLCGRAFEKVRQEHFMAVTLWVMTSNYSARNFYEAMGFKLDGAVKVEQIVENKHEVHEARYRVPV
jgi:ribosomal protein S18 acetylase RimI-like enzyme